ncbi:hypothetical protein [Paractinoplanes hotanensis]|uniref:Uncharacterized protein n=1 Tax=Paractinoplanes hotanensis TaxID=2906497 RepID=A0ABT0Y9Q2_9ACTN|nr:hypothetical protein [Actinoplanes hotanensis]MCM4082202.1 hypothetical protein [Actinoplanes hotanensis]
MTTTLTVERGFPARTGYAVKLLHEAIHDVHRAVNTLDLCADAPHWPSTHQLSTWDVPRWVEIVHQFRSHAEDACACNPNDRRQAADLTEQWLHLWTQALRHIERPDCHDKYAVLRALYVVRDFADHLENAEAFPILAYDPLATAEISSDDLPIWHQVEHDNQPDNLAPADDTHDSDRAEQVPAHHGHGDPPF